MIDYNEIDKRCRAYRFTFEITNGTAYIHTGVDTWKLIEADSRIELWHKNKRYKTSKYHLQKSFNQLYQVFKYMNGHMHSDKHMKQNRLIFLFNLI